MIILTSAKFFLNKRVSSAVLYAAIPPVTQSRIFLFESLIIFIAKNSL